MAENSFRSRLSRLFSTQVIVRRVGKNRIKVLDTSKLQSGGSKDSALRGRYTGLHTFRTHNNRSTSGYSSMLATKLELYRDYECMSGDTEIPMIDGNNKTLMELAELYPTKNDKFYVYSYDHENDRIQIGTAHSVRKTKTAQTYKITFDDGSFLIATDNHPFLMRDGNYKRVDELLVGESVMPFYQKRFFNQKYRFVYGFSDKWISEHRLVAEQFDRNLLENEVVHHKDFNKENNHPSNLQIMDDSEHKSYHAKINNKYIWSSENYDRQCKAVSKGLLNANLSWGCKRKGKNNPFFGKKHTKESNNKRSHSLKEYYKKKRPPISNITFDSISNVAYDILKNGDNLDRKTLCSKLDCSNTTILSRIKPEGFTTYPSFREHIENTLNHTIVSIEKHDVRDVYDMTVDKYHNFATTVCFVHNCMDEDPILSSALDIYSDECCIKNPDGVLLKITSSNDKVKQILNNLFYDILNIEFNLWTWVRNTCKYGDMMLALDLDEEIGVVNVIPISPYDVERIEGEDPDRPYEVKFRYNMHSQNQPQGNLKEEYKYYEMAHFRLLTDTNYLPYGRSMLQPARKEFKRLVLMEDAMMIHRIMRAPQRRIYKISVGNVNPNEIDQYMQKIIDSTKKIPYIDETTGQYNLKFNLQNMVEDIYIPVRGGDASTEVDTLDGLSNEGFIDDVEYIKNKMMAALKIPKAFLGYDENTDGKAVLAAEDVRFARTIERIQNIVESELNKIAVIHLFLQGYTDASLVDFELQLNNPSIIYKRQQIDILNEQVALSNSMKELKLFSRKHIYEHVFGLSSSEWEAEQERLLQDQLLEWRMEQMLTEGNDPLATGKAKGTPHAIASMHVSKKNNEIPEDEDDVEETRGRPKEKRKFGTHRDEANGRDPLGFRNTMASIGSGNIKMSKERNMKTELLDILKKNFETNSKLSDILND